MPTGCGEQIMATMAPNIYILKYLTSTKQINSKLYGRLVKNLKIGINVFYYYKTCLKLAILFRIMIIKIQTICNFFTFNVYLLSFVSLSCSKMIFDDNLFNRLMVLFEF